MFLEIINASWSLYSPSSTVSTEMLLLGLDKDYLETAGRRLVLGLIWLSI